MDIDSIEFGCTISILSKSNSLYVGEFANVSEKGIFLKNVRSLGKLNELKKDQNASEIKNTYPFIFFATEDISEIYSKDYNEILSSVSTNIEGSDECKGSNNEPQSCSKPVQEKCATSNDEVSLLVDSLNTATLESKSKNVTSNSSSKKPSETVPSKESTNFDDRFTAKRNIPKKENKKSTLGSGNKETIKVDIPSKEGSTKNAHSREVSETKAYSQDFSSENESSNGSGKAAKDNRKKSRMNMSFPGGEMCKVSENQPVQETNEGIDCVPSKEIGKKTAGLPGEQFKRNRSKNLNKDQKGSSYHESSKGQDNITSFEKPNEANSQSCKESTKRNKNFVVVKDTTRRPRNETGHNIHTEEDSPANVEILKVDGGVSTTKSESHEIQDYIENKKNSGSHEKENVSFEYNYYAKSHHNKKNTAEGAKTKSFGKSDDKPRQTHHHFSPRFEDKHKSFDEERKYSSEKFHDKKYYGKKYSDEKYFDNRYSSEKSYSKKFTDKKHSEKKNYSKDDYDHFKITDRSTHTNRKFTNRNRDSADGIIRREPWDVEFLKDFDLVAASENLSKEYAVKEEMGKIESEKNDSAASNTISSSNKANESSNEKTPSGFFDDFASHDEPERRTKHGNRRRYNQRNQYPKYNEKK